MLLKITFYFCTFFRPTTNYGRLIVNKRKRRSRYRKMCVTNYAEQIKEITLMFLSNIYSPNDYGRGRLVNGY